MNAICYSYALDANLSTNSKNSSSFIGFAIHALTSWQPSLPLSLPQIIQNDKARANGLIQEILFGGAITINKYDIPCEVPIVTYNNPTIILDNNNSNELITTKKMFLLDYNKRLNEYKKILEILKYRELQIQNLNKLLNKTYNECFIGINNLNQTYNILGISMPLPLLANNEIDIENISLLVNWEVINVNNENINLELFEFNDIMTENSHKIEFPESPKTTQINMKWITINELIHTNSSVISFETLIRVPYNIPLGWHWNIIETNSNKKEKKSAKTEPIVTETLYSDPGTIPVVFMSLDTSSYFVETEIDIENDENSAINDQINEFNAMKLQDNIETDNLNEENRTQIIEKTRKEKVLVPKSSHLSLSVAIHGDVMKSTEYSDDIVVILQEIRQDFEEPLVMRVELPNISIIPLQRTTFHIPIDRLPINNNSNNQSFVFWIRLLSKRSVYLTFHCAVNLHISEPFKLYNSIKNTEKIIENNNENIQQTYCITKNGTMLTSTRINYEKLLFRIKLSIGINEILPPNCEVLVTVFLHISDPKIAKYVSMLLLSIDNENNNEINNDNTESISNDNNELVSYSFPRIINNRFIIKTNSNGIGNKLLVTRIFSNIEKIQSFDWNLTILSTQPLIDTLYKPIMTQPINNTKNTIINEQINKIFEGNYTSNNELLLFKDIYTIDKSTFPLAMKLSLHQIVLDSDVTETERDNTSMKDENEMNVEEDVWLIMKIYRLIDNNRELIKEIKGKSIISLYNLELNLFINEIITEELTPNENIVSKPLTAGKNTRQLSPPTKKTLTKETKDKDKLSLETIDMLIECYIDEKSMIIPDYYHSDKPYIYNESYQLNSQFQWKIEILYGNIINVMNDMIQLNKYLLIKNQWEETNIGRYNSGIAALEAYNTRKLLREIQGDRIFNNILIKESARTQISIKSKDSNIANANANTKLNKKSQSKSKLENIKSVLLLNDENKDPLYLFDKTIDSIAIALGKDKSVISNRYEILKRLQPVSLFID